MSAFQDIRFAVADGVATITLHRPEKLNAYTVEMGEEVGSAGLRVLVSALKQARRWNRGDVRLANVSGRGRSVLELAGMDVLFTMYDSTVDAVGSF